LRDVKLADEVRGFSDEGAQRPRAADQRDGNMRRGIFRFLGLVLAILCAGSICQAQEVQFSPNTGMPRIENAPAQPPLTVADLAYLSSDFVDQRYIGNTQRHLEVGPWDRMRDGCGEQFHRLWNDATIFYRGENLLHVGLVVGIAAPLANTSADREIQEWYQRQAGDGRSGAVDRISDVGRFFGEYQYTLPALIAMSLGGHLFPDHAVLSPLGQFGDRSLRAMAVGAPTIGILQVSVGGRRPPDSSDWQLFRYGRGVSGHAFIGAVPFLAAASMTESRPLKAVLFAGSMWTGWSRMHDNAHYFSQSFIGWSVAFLAMQAVNQTENDTCRIVPMAFPDGVGVGLHVQY
jgi:hypothetical protein